MNRGLRSGVVPTVWRAYKPRLVTVNANADGSGLTQPVLDTYDGKYQYGRYMVLRDVVFVQVQIQFVGSSTVGAGTAYAISLPVPAKRPVPGQAWGQNIGSAMCYWSIAEPFVNVPCSVIAADPWASLNGTEDDYMQLVAPEYVAWGNATITTSQNSVAVTTDGTNGSGTALAFPGTPSAADFTVVQTDVNGTNDKVPLYLTSISSSGFTINRRGVYGAGGSLIQWKLAADPPTGQGGNQVGPKMPFNWSRFTALSPYGNIFITATYEPR